MTDDLSTLASGQLHAALARYQKAVAEGEAIPRPSAFGLAISHYQCTEGIGCLLLHESGALLDSGPVEAPTVMEAAQRAAQLVLGTVGAIPVAAASVSAQTEAPAPVEPAAPAADVQVITTETHPAAVSREGILIDVEGILARMDALHTQSPDALKSLIVSYKERFNIGRTPMPKSITTPERAQFLLDALGA